MHAVNAPTDVAIVPQADRPGDSPWRRHDGASVAVSGAIAGPSPTRWIDWCLLDSPTSTRFYWGAVALVVAGLFVTQLLPCVDYPQHLALSDIARRLGNPNAPEHGEYELNFFTYNGLFHLLVAALSFVLPTEIAGRLVVAGSLLAMAAAVVALVRVLRRPLFHAALFTPVLFSFPLGWGFVNYVTATSVAVFTLVFIARCTIRPRLTTALAVASLGLLCAFAHVLAMLILCAFGAGLALEIAWREARVCSGAGRRAFRTVLRASLALLPLVFGCLYCIAVYRRQFGWDPGMYRDPTMEGSAPPIWQKFVFFGAFASDLFGDATDQVVLWLALGLMAWSAHRYWRDRQKGDRGAEEPSPIVLPFVAMTLAYFTTPMVLIGTHLIFPRLGQWTVLSAVLATPAFPEHLVVRAKGYVLRLGLISGVSMVFHCALFGWETRDASAVIDDLPEGGAATAVIWDPSTIAFRNGTLTHLAAYYAARKHGRWAFAFARYLSVPVRFRAGSQPAWPAMGWEFSGEDYNPRCKYARAFPLVIVKAPEEIPGDADGESAVRTLLFKRDAPSVKLLSHHGHFWAFDTTGLPEDGTL